MSFRIINPDKQIMYYTVILDKGQIQQNKDDHAMLRITPPQPKRKWRRNIERIVYDTDKNEWVSITTYPD